MCIACCGAQTTLFVGTHVQGPHPAEGAYGAARPSTRPCAGAPLSPFVLIMLHMHCLAVHYVPRTRRLHALWLICYMYCSPSVLMSAACAAGPGQC